MERAYVKKEEYRQKLLHLMKEKEYRQVDMAVLLDVQQGTISNYLAGRTGMPAKTRYKFDFLWEGLQGEQDRGRE